MCCRAIYFILIFYTSQILAQSVPHLDWEYKEPEGIGDFIKVDNHGHFIIVGNTDNISSLGYSRIKIIKQDKNGNIIWQQKYVDSITTYVDRAFDVAIDTFDNIYIAGRTNFDSSVPPPDFSQSILLKYDSLGNLIWVRKWANNLGIGGGAKRMQLFQDKLIYVVGYMDSWSSGFTNSFILQYDSSGVLNWTDSTNYTFDNSFVDVELDKLGNSYAIGVTACCLPGFDTRVVKYDLSGIKRWSKILTDSIHLYAYPKDAVIDDSSNIYVGGDTKKISGPSDYDLFMSKIDSSGNQKWWTTYASTTNSNWESIAGVVTDYNFDTYLYGYVLPYGSGGNTLGLITKINKNGLVDWSWKYDSLSGGKEGAIYSGILCKDSSMVFGGSALKLNSSQPGILSVSFKPSGIKNWQFESICNCYINSLVESDSAFYATGWIYQNSNLDNDSLFSCKLSYDSSNSINILSENLLKVYPNPFSEELNLKLVYTRVPVTVRLYNLLGKILLEKEIYSNEFNLNTSQLPKGFYLLEITYSNKKYQRIKLSKI